MPILVFSEKLKEYASPSPLKYFMRNSHCALKPRHQKNVPYKYLSTFLCIDGPVLLGVEQGKPIFY